MLSKGLNANANIMLYGITIDDISIVEANLDANMKKNLQGDDNKISFASILACSEGAQPIFLDEPMLLMVSGEGSKDGIPKSILDSFAVTGEDQLDIRTWVVSGSDETVVAAFDNGSYKALLFNAPADEDVVDDTTAIRGADGQIYMIPGRCEDYRAPEGVADFINQLPGDSIELIDMKNIAGNQMGIEGGDSTGGMRATMTRATMTRATMMRATMMRATMMRATMMRATMMRATMMRATMVTSDHDDEDR